MTRSELEMFALLSKQGLPVQKSIQLSFREASSILSALEEGHDLMEILFSEPLEDWKIMKELTSVLSFQDALSLLEKLDDHSKKIWKDLMKKIGYPVFVFFFSFFLAEFFMDTIVPQMLSYMDPPFVLSFLSSAMKGSMVILSMLLLLGIYIYYERSIAWLEKILRSSSIYRNLRSVQFSSLFSTLLQAHLTSQEALKTIASIHSLPYCSRIAERVLEQLARGKELIECFEDLDPEFQFFFSMGMESQRAAQMLDVYLQKKAKEIESFMKKVSQCFQILSYSCVGVLVIVVYEVLLSPLSLLSTF